MLPSTFLRFSSDLMLFSPDICIKTCLVDNVTESDKFVLTSVLLLPMSLSSCRTILLSRDFHCPFALAGGKLIFWRLALMLAKFFVWLLSVDFLSTVVFNLALVFRRLTCLGSVLFFIRRSIQTTHFSPFNILPFT